MHTKNITISKMLCIAALTFLFASTSAFKQIHCQTPSHIDKLASDMPPHSLQEVTLANGLTIIFNHKPNTPHISSSFTFKNTRALAYFLVEKKQLAAFEFLINHIFAVQMLIYANELSQSHDTSEQIEHVVFLNQCHNKLSPNQWTFADVCISAEEYCKHNYQELTQNFKSYKENVIKESLNNIDDDEDDDDDDYSMILNQENIQYLDSALTKVLAQHKNLATTKIYNVHASLLLMVTHYFNNESSEALAQSLSDNNLIQLAKEFFNPTNIIVEITSDFTNDSKLAEKIYNFFTPWKNRKELVDVNKFTIPPYKETLIATDIPTYTPIKIQQPQKKMLEPFDQNRIIIMGMDNKKTIDDDDHEAMLLLEIIINNHLSDHTETQGLFQDNIDFSVYHKDDDLFFINEGTSIVFNYDSIIAVIAAPKSDQCHQTEQFIINLLQNAIETHYTQEELDKARVELQAKLLHTTECSNYMYLKAFNLPYDYYTKQLSSLNKITTQDIQRVAQKYLDPKTWTFVTIEPDLEQHKTNRWFSWLW